MMQCCTARCQWKIAIAFESDKLFVIRVNIYPNTKQYEEKEEVEGRLTGRR